MANNATLTAKAFQPFKWPISKKRCAYLRRWVSSSSFIKMRRLSASLMVSGNPWIIFQLGIVMFFITPITFGVILYPWWVYGQWRPAGANPLLERL